MKRNADVGAFPEARHLVRRKSYIRDLPRSANIPKFLRPAEIARVRELKSQHPKISWDAAVRVVVLNAASDLSC